MANVDPQTIATFNDATRALVGGLWSTAVEEGNQGFGSIVRYTNDLTAVQTSLTAFQAQDASPQLAAILKDITTALSASAATVDGGQGFASVADAQSALRTAHLDILQQAANDPLLADAGLVAVPATLADPLHAPHATFADIGVMFNDLLSRSLGGLTPETAPAFTKEVNAIEKDLKHVIAQHPDQFDGLTGILANTIVNQLELQKTYDAQYGFDPAAARGTNDNFLDIIDIVQGNTNLANLANVNGANGWSATGEALKPTTPYQDNADQTNFWADFIAQSNSLGQSAEQLVGSGDKAAIKGLISDLHHFQQNTENFAQAQGGIFEARFDNELLGAKSTTGAEVSALIKGLQTHNSALVTAAAEEMHANAADVSSNNVPLNGGTYNGDGVTVAEALSTAVLPLPAPSTTPLVPVAPTKPVPLPDVPVVMNDNGAQHDGGVQHGHVAEAQNHHLWG